jgi:type IV pilus assembly protein PilA
MRSISKGFTLIELMITVAIIGILASVALPAYQDYTVRAKMSEVLLAAGSCRTVITEVYQGGGSTGPGAGSWGCEGVTSKYVASLTTDINGKITIVTGGGLPLGDLTMLPLANGVAAVAANLSSGPIAINGWRCGAAVDGTNLSTKYLPGSCRGT